MHEDSAITDIILEALNLTAPTMTTVFVMLFLPGI